MIYRSYTIVGDDLLEMTVDTTAVPDKQIADCSLTWSNKQTWLSNSMQEVSFHLRPYDKDLILGAAVNDVPTYYALYLAENSPAQDMLLEVLNYSQPKVVEVAPRCHRPCVISIWLRPTDEFDCIRELEEILIATWLR